jgi:hypothetical protein
MFEGGGCEGNVRLLLADSVEKLENARTAISATL